MQTLLICGGTKKERLEKALEKTKGVGKQDLILLESEASLGINQIKRLEHLLALKPYSSPFKVALLEGAESLTLPAQNALLKTLEEPPKNTLIILTAPDSETLLPTIASRCQIIELPPKGDDQISEEEFKKEVLALSELEEQSSSKVARGLKLAAQGGKSREEVITFLNKQILIWREILLKKFKTPEKLPKYLSHLTSQELLAALRNLQKTKRFVEANVNPRLALEIFFLNFLSAENGE